MKIAIIGAGGVGAYFGAKLQKAGNEVVFVARGAHLQAIQRDGLKIKSIQGDFVLPKARATDDIKSIQNPDLILVTTKAWQVKEVAAQINEITKENTVVIPLQNGVLAVEDLSTHIPLSNIIPGLCQIISTIEAPGVINHFGIDPRITIGEIDNVKSDRILRIQTIFNEAGIKLKIAENIEEDLWKKFILICVGGLITVCRSTYGEARAIPETRQLIIDLLKETHQVSQAAGIDIRPSYINKMMAFIDSFPPNATSSLCRDVWTGKPSEIESKNGAVVKLGQKYGVETPINRFIYHCVLPMEAKARGKIF